MPALTFRRSTIPLANRRPLSIPAARLHGGSCRAITPQNVQALSHLEGAMSKSAVKEFLARVTRDPALQKELIDLAAKHGFTITTDDLTDAQLDAVVGGTLSIGSPEDRHEREADKSADGVMR